jgi:hypothetical protein
VIVLCELCALIMEPVSAQQSVLKKFLSPYRVGAGNRTSSGSAETEHSKAPPVLLPSPPASLGSRENSIVAVPIPIVSQASSGSLSSSSVLPVPSSSAVETIHIDDNSMNLQLQASPMAPGDHQVVHESTYMSREVDLESAELVNVSGSGMRFGDETYDPESTGFDFMGLHGSGTYGGNDSMISPIPIMGENFGYESPLNSGTLALSSSMSIPIIVSPPPLNEQQPTDGGNSNSNPSNSSAPTSMTDVPNSSPTPPVARALFPPAPSSPKTAKKSLPAPTSEEIAKVGNVEVTFAVGNGSNPAAIVPRTPSAASVPLAKKLPDKNVETPKEDEPKIPGVGVVHTTFANFVEKAANFLKEPTPNVVNKNSDVPKETTMTTEKVTEETTSPFIMMPLADLLSGTLAFLSQTQAISQCNEVNQPASGTEKAPSPPQQSISFITKQNHKKMEALRDRLHDISTKLIDVAKKSNRPRLIEFMETLLDPHIGRLLTIADYAESDKPDERTCDLSGQKYHYSKLTLCVLSESMPFSHELKAHIFRIYNDKRQRNMQFIFSLHLMNVFCLYLHQKLKTVIEGIVAEMVMGRSTSSANADAITADSVLAKFNRDAYNLVYSKSLASLTRFNKIYAAFQGNAIH